MNHDLLPSFLFKPYGEIGVEEEFYLVDKKNFSPIEDPKEFFKTLPKKLENNLGVELFDFVIETWVNKSKTIKETKKEIKQKRKLLKQHAKKFDYKIIGAGLHPNMNWRIYEHSKKQDYKRQLKRIQFPQKRNTTAGLHIHVGMGDRQKALWIANEIRRYLPLFLALSANSPFWQERDTGLQSARALIFENLPNTGIPSFHKNINEYVGYIQQLLNNNLIEKPREIWWDVRINNKYGTLEVRAPDSQNKITKTYSLLKLIYGTIDYLNKQYDRGKENTRLKQERLIQNKWQALRYGKKADFVLENQKITVKDLLEKLIQKTGLTDKDIEPIKGETGANLQRKTYKNDGMHHLLESLVI
ncbi:carboxylate--amine ligase [archaeon SCG-AAA382B04]|nr:carboxylate--amine ligase [archaeon SCG-AAA382B04]